MCMSVCRKCADTPSVSQSLFSETLINQQVLDYQGHLSLTVADLLHLCTPRNCRGSPHTCSSCSCPLPHQVNRGFKARKQYCHSLHHTAKEIVSSHLIFMSLLLLASQPVPCSLRGITVSHLLKTTECILIIFKQVKKIPKINWELLQTSSGKGAAGT